MAGWAESNPREKNDVEKNNVSCCKGNLATTVTHGKWRCADWLGSSVGIVETIGVLSCSSVTVQ